MSYMDTSDRIVVFFMIIVNLPARLTNWSDEDHVIQALVSIVACYVTPIERN
jgi:hypothetical protein